MWTRRSASKARKSPRADAGDVRLEILIAGDRQVPPKVGDGPYVAKVMAATEVGIRLESQNALSQGLLNLARLKGGGLERGQVAAHLLGDDLTHAPYKQIEKIHGVALLAVGGKISGVIATPVGFYLSSPSKQGRGVGREGPDYLPTSPKPSPPKRRRGEEEIASGERG